MPENSTKSQPTNQPTKYKRKSQRMGFFEKKTDFGSKTKNSRQKFSTVEFEASLETRVHASCP